MLSGIDKSGKNPALLHARRLTALMLFILALSAISPANAQRSSNAFTCEKKHFNQNLTAFLIQACFDEERIRKLASAVQRREVPLRPDNQAMADTLTNLTSVNRDVLDAMLMQMSRAEISEENQSQYLAHMLLSYRGLSLELGRLRLDEKSEDIKVYIDIAAKVAAGDWALAKKRSLGLKAHALYTRKRTPERDRLRPVRAARSENLQGKLALLESDFIAASRHFAAAAELVGPDTERGQQYSEAAADALYATANVDWNQKTLQDSINIYRRVIDARPRSQSPKLWARTQNKLGQAIVLLSSGDRDVQLLTGALSAFDAALEVYKKDSDPEEWSEVTANLAGALMQIGNRLGAEKELREAIETYKAAISVVDVSTDPGNWVSLQTNLGNALWSLGRLEKGADNLRAAARVFSDTLPVLNLNRQPRDWGATQNNIGATYFLIAERNSDVADAQRAVDAFMASLAAYQQASAVYFIPGVRNNLIRAEQLLQEKVAQEPPPPSANASPGNQVIR